jgi:AcrR family transcriptional regulator
MRAGLRRLVARNGFHGASMSAVAAEAGVAAGTAYVHYDSKDDLVLATYLEAKRELGAAAIADLDRSVPAAERFLHMWHRIHRHLAADPDRARFLIQVKESLTKPWPGYVPRVPEPTLFSTTSLVIPY